MRMAIFPTQAEWRQTKDRWIAVTECDISYEQGKLGSGERAGRGTCPLGSCAQQVLVSEAVSRIALLDAMSLAPPEGLYP